MSLADGLQQKTVMRILVCNDDGIYSPGIAALAEVASAYGTVRVVAPNVEQSSMGHAITANRPLSYRKTKIAGLDAFRVNGTPADCVALGSHHWESVDVVLSGCNLGLNIGNGIWHSGTLSAAKQAVMLGLRGIAFSMPAGLEDFTELKPWMHRVLDVLLQERDLPLVNVNFPREPRGLIWTRVSVRRYDGIIVPTKDPYGRELYWFGVTPVEGAEEGTDRWAVEQHWVSMTPISLDLTDEARLADCRARQPLDEPVAAVVSKEESSPAEAKSVQRDEASTIEAQ
jgi:5'-nucleotidase